MMSASELLVDFDFGDEVDTTTFEQILDMDDEDDGSHEFSSSIVFGFFEQAENTFEKMDHAVEDVNLQELSSLGHFLKGSSATLGYTNIKLACEKIQHFGAMKDETGTNDIDDKNLALEKIKECIEDAKSAYVTVEGLMRSFYAKLEVS